MFNRLDQVGSWGEEVTEQVTEQQTEVFSRGMSVEDDEDQKNAEVAEIRKGIDSMNENAATIKELEKATFEAVDSNAITRHMQEVDRLTAESVNLATSLRQRLEDLREKNAEFANRKKKEKEKHSTRVIWRKNELNTVTKGLRTAMVNVQEAANRFKTVVSKRTVRQLGILQNMTEEEKRDMEEQAERDPYKLQQQLLQQIDQYNLTEQTADRIEELEQQNEDMKNIEKSVNTIKEMFEVMAAMVDEQGVMLNDIENNVEQTRDHIAIGTKQLNEAEKHVISARKKGLCATVCCIGVIAVGVILIIKLVG